MWCGEDVLKGLEQLFPLGTRINNGAGSDTPTTHAGPVMGAPVEPERHRKGGEVLDDGAQRPQPLDAKDEVECAQIKREAVDGEALHRGWRHQQRHRHRGYARYHHR